MSMNRREFLAYSAAATLLASTMKAVAEETGFRLGSQSYSFRHFGFKESIDELKKLGLNSMEFCSVHFPPNAEDDAFQAAFAHIQEIGLEVPCFGVEGFGGDAAANLQRFEFGKVMNLEVLTAHPAPESLDQLEELVEAFDIKIGIHNHGPNHAYDKVQDTLDACEGRHAHIGACVDTGHAIRSAEKPHEVIRALGARVHSLHLKDWIHGGEEQVIGEGDMDLVEVVRALREVGFSGPLMFEYELEKENPVPGMLRGLENFRKACAEA